MNTKMGKIIEKWFEKHETLSKDNYGMLKEMISMFQDEPEADIPKEVEIITHPLVTIKPRINRGLENKQYNRGVTIARVSNVPILSNILSNILENFKEQSKCDPNDLDKRLNSLMEKYYPSFKPKSIIKYVWGYKVYLGKKYLMEIGEINKPEKIIAKQPVEQPPTDAYAYNELYQTHILKREVDRVVSALRKVRFGYTPTVKNIAEETDMSHNRVRAVLTTLIAEDKVSVTTSGVMGIKTYHMKGG